MKTIKRTFTLVLTLAVLLAGLSFPAIQYEAIAETGMSSGVEGTNDVGTAPDELLQSGEWLYYLDGDEIVIAGYRKKGEESLSVPSRIGNQIVVGIGDNAFTNDKSLKTIYIPSTVYRISNNAFISGITIEAYNGAFALEYADKMGMGYHNKSTYSFVHNVVDLSGMPRKCYSSLSRESVIVNKQMIKYFQIGQIVYFPVQGIFSTGYAASIVSNAENENSFQITLASPDIQSVFTEITVDKEEIIIDWDHAMCMDKEISIYNKNGIMGAGSGSTKKTINIGTIPVGSIATISGSIDIKSIEPKVSASLDIKNMRLNHASFDICITAEESITIKSKKEFAKNAKDSDGKNLYKKLVRLPAISIAGGINGYIEIYLTGSLSGSFKVEARVTSGFSSSYKNGQFNFDPINDFKVIKTELKGEAKFGPGVSFYFVIGVAGLNVRFIETSVELCLVVSVKDTHSYEITGAKSNICCIDASINFELEIKMQMGIIKVEIGTKDTKVKGGSVSVSKTWDWPVPGYSHFHVEEGILVENCTLKDRELKFYYGYNGKNIETEKYDVGEKIVEKEIGVCRDGYRFAGWYLSTIDSGLPGQDRKWNFNTDRMPYTDYGPIVLYAKWINLSTGQEESAPSIGRPDRPVGGQPVWHPEPPKPVEVSSITLNKTNEILHIDGEHKDKLYLSAVVSPANAEDSSVTWTSSNDAVATVDGNGVVSAVAQGEGKITCRSNMNPNIFAECTVHVYKTVDVTDIQLDKTSEELWANESDKNTIQLSATVIPANATYTSVHWSSSDKNVAWVDGWGKVTGLSAGTATITCTSVKNQDVKATCQITVHQHVRDIFVTAEKEGLLPGETAQLSALCYPTDSDNKNVSWASSDEAVATVNATGVVTALTYGEAIITATSVDGGNVSGSHSVTVEHELALVGNVQNDKLYLDGDNSVVIGYAFATQGSVRRMIERGYDLEWTLLNGETEVADAYYDVVSSTYTIDGQDYEIATAVLYSGKLHGAGTATFTLQCKAGPYTATVDLSTTVSGDTLAKVVTLDPSTFDLEMDEIAHIPSTPIATDGGVIPRILSVYMSGDAYYRSHAHESSDDNGLCVWFPESGQYTANVIFKAANITYTVPVTFQVRDENGIMRLPVTEVALSDSMINMVVGDTYQLTAEVLPADAYNRNVSWVSEDESIATVSQDGLVIAKARGIVYIHCEANDGSNCYDSCALNIEPFMALNETSIEKTIYLDGQTHVAIDSCSLTYQSAIRIEEQGLTPNWRLLRVSGDATEIALNEFTAVADGNVHVEGEEIELLRANHVGVDKYQLVCEAGAFSATCDIIMTVVEGGKLPESISLVTDNYVANVGEVVTIDTSVTCIPDNIELPEDVYITLEPTKAFWNAIEDGTYFADFNCTFAKTGEYSATLVYSGANYRYALPFTVQIKDENGDVPVSIQDIVMSDDNIQLFAGETKQLIASVLPDNAPYGELEWSSFDTSIATVSENGIVTAMDAGVTYIVASSQMTDHSAICLVTVEDGLTLEDEVLSKTIFIDGTTRTTLEDVYLTEASSKRLNDAPEWKLQRVSGNNLTLRVKECESTNASGDVVFGCSVILYSVSAEGQTVYDLVCTSGSESASMRVIVNAITREGNIPASISLTPTSYEAGVDELIVVNPEVSCWPENTQLPVGTRVEFIGNKQFIEAINQEDWYVSQSISTFSFKEAGRYEANCIYRYANISYTIPITFNIHDDQGEVPVHGLKMKLNNTSLQLVAGEESQLEAVFMPVDVTDSSVTWMSSDSSVATVSADGHVYALANGTTEITCTPSDTYCSAVTCYVTVEDYLTVETGNTSYTCYLEGEQANNLSSAWLSEGTVMRLNRDGIKPIWTLNTVSGNSAVISGKPEKDGSRILVATTSLTSSGTTVYSISCMADEYQWSQDYSVTIQEAGVQAPEKVTLATPEISLSVGESKTIDFTPVCLPAGTSLPMGITTNYVGMGGFYDALDRSVFNREGDNVTAAFTKPGRYLLARVYRVRNLDYTAQCVINVEADVEAGFGLLRATEQECIVYLNGKSGAVSDISIYDAMVYERYGHDIQWAVERLSGDSVSVGLIPNADTATLFVADAEKTGTDVWRVSCEFGGLKDFVDITIEVKEARKPIPDSIELSTKRVTGVIGTWLYLPLGVKCIPEGSALPETGDSFWSFKMLGGLAEDVSESKIENGSLAVCFSESGYYTGTLAYDSGNVSYSLQVFFTVYDEESQIDTPDQLKVWLLSDSSTIYPEGETRVKISTAVLAENLNSYYAGTSPSYVSDKGIEWSITVGTDKKLSLSIQPHTANTADIWLDAIEGIGDEEFTVSCVVDGKTYIGNGTLHIASENEERPDVTLKKSRYQVTQGTPALISRVLYQRSNGSVLQSAGEWDVGNALSAIGYTYETLENEWKVIFYKKGEYTTTVTTYVGNLRYDLPLTVNVVGKGENEQTRMLKLPATLSQIEEEAFSGLTIQVIDMRGTRVDAINSCAFKNCSDLTDIYIPDSVTSIANDAFYGCINLTIHCSVGSVADTFAVDHGISVSHDME